MLYHQKNLIRALYVDILTIYWHGVITICISVCLRSGKVKIYKWNIYVNVYPWRYPEVLFKWIFIIFNIMKKCVHVNPIFLDIDTINQTNFQWLLLIFWPFSDIFGILMQLLSPVASEWILQLCHLDIPKYSSRKWVLFGLLKV